MVSRDRGFTLVELLIVVAIIAMLAAIAVPQFQAYIQRSVSSRMVSDAKNAVITQENYRAENQTYIIVPETLGPSTVAVGIDAIRVSKDNRLKIDPGATGIADSYIVTVTSPNAAPGKSPLTWHSTGVCTWADGSSC